MSKNKKSSTDKSFSEDKIDRIDRVLRRRKKTNQQICEENDYEQDGVFTYNTKRKYRPSKADLQVYLHNDELD